MFKFPSTLKDTMIWSIDRITEHYRLALLRVVAGLFVSAGMGSGSAGVKVLPRSVRNAILFVLRPAESAARRLAFVEARKLETPDTVPPAARRRPGKVGTGKKTGPRPPLFCLIDRRKAFEELHPNRRTPRAKPRVQGSTEPQIQVRIAGFDGQPDFVIWSEPKADPMPDDEVGAVRVCRRLLALKLALEELPKQAERLVREMAKRAKAPPGPGRAPPLRLGFPPGYRQRHAHEVDEILWECHCLVTRPPDTS